MIPIENIYYLLCYSWDKLEEGDRIKVSKDDFDDLLNLFAKVFVSGVTYVLKRGLDRTYNEQTQSYQGIKGKLLLTPSIKRNQFYQGMATCNFDEFDYNTLHNKIIKFTLKKILFTKGIKGDTKQSVRLLAQRFHRVADQQIQLSDFNKVRLHRNNQFYEFILNVSRLILENLTLNEADGKYEFQDFIRNEKKMARLFEAFLFNFYRKESDFKVRRETIKWNAVHISGADDLLPTMKTDITLEKGNRKILMDAKYYKQALQSYYDKESIHSGNLYQLTAYLRNNENPNAEGILIYPAVKKEIATTYKMEGYTVTIVTINLNQAWTAIRADLLTILTK